VKLQCFSGLVNFVLIVIGCCLYFYDRSFRLIVLWKTVLQVFYWTHLLYIPFWVLIIFHGPNFWKWFIVPGILYLFERFFRLATMRSERGKTYISSGLLLPSRVTHLVIKRPHQFDFHPGDYVFVNVPAIAKYEWHPFTISSAPEQEGEFHTDITLHFTRGQNTDHSCIKHDVMYLNHKCGCGSIHGRKTRRLGGFI